ncbi:hypothetical protein BKA69DRAFT_1129037 [Paraphysoderma sedebokerense]|nr:hypothetical protein BKA69DRAFT_1129037 [Paraphysoderma sedebokerense]
MIQIKSTALAFLLIVASLAPTPVNSHSWLVSPFARAGPGSIQNVGNDAGGNWAPACAWIGKDKANPGRFTYKRGQSITVKWPRNNHPGGFVRLALVPFGSTQNHQDFDKNIVQYNCHETDCRSHYQPPLGGDGSQYKEGENICSVKWTVPAWVKDGQYTLQWMWHGGGSYYNNWYRGQADYYQCSDFTIRGSVSGNNTIARRPKCPVWKGGDVHKDRNGNKNMCFYFNKGNKPHQCAPDGCPGNYKFGVPSALLDLGCVDSQGKSKSGSPIRKRCVKWSNN